MPNALITGGSAGLGRALAFELARRGWTLTIDARHREALATSETALSRLTRTRAVLGDITAAEHRAELVRAAAELGAIDLVVNNASDLGPSPLPALRDLTEAAYARLWLTNVVAPQQLVQAAWAQLSPTAVIVNISSDAGVEHYETWGGYGSTKAALAHQTLTWAAEEPQLTWYAVDPGDLRTAMHQAAFPGEDITDRPEPESVAPLIVDLVESGQPSGRYRAADLAAALVDFGLEVGAR
jgi:NAD(P)-dependent dehydrogenase (short-subunit alcohol dehydrogenase family)